jgi:hypothetical protein
MFSGEKSHHVREGGGEAGEDHCMCVYCTVMSKVRRGDVYTCHSVDLDSESKLMIQWTISIDCYSSSIYVETSDKE